MQGPEIREISCGYRNKLRDDTLLPATRHKWTRFALTPAMQVGTRFANPGGIEGWVDLGGWLARWFTWPQTVTHPSSNRARCRLTMLIEASTLTTTPRHLVVLVCFVTKCDNSSVKPKSHYTDFPVTSATSLRQTRDVPFSPNSITPIFPKLPRPGKYRLKVTSRICRELVADVMG